MIDALLSLSTLAGCAVSMVFTSIVGLVVYFVFYKLISKYKREDLKDPTSSLFRVVGMLVSLMLALAFSEVIIELRTIRSAVQREAAAISDIFTTLEQFEDKKTQEIRTLLIDYTQAIIDDDWPALADDKLGKRTGALKKQLTKAVMNYRPTTTQEKLWPQILADLDLLSDLRFIRLDSALAKPPIFVYVIMFGFLVTMACFGAYRPQAALLLLVILYTLFVGLVLFLILQLSDPFQGDIGVTSTSFEYLIETFQAEMK